MPAVTYRCPSCGTEVSAVVFKRPEPHVPCSRCGGTAHRVAGAPAARVVETLDNGVVTRRVERMKDIEEILRERSKKGGNGR